MLREDWKTMKYLIAGGILFVVVMGALTEQVLAATGSEDMVSVNPVRALIAAAGALFIGGILYIGRHQYFKRKIKSTRR